MQRSAFGFGVVAIVASVGVAALVGCAVGAEPEGLGESELTNLPVEAGNGDENSVVLPPKTTPTEEEDAGGGGGTDSGGGGKDAGVDSGGGTDAGVDSGGGTGGTACASPNTCVGSTDLGTISGDTGAGVKTAQGSGSQWFKVRVTEDDSNVFGLSLLAKAELTSPPGTNFDVFVYVAGSSSATECSAVSASGTSSAALDTAKAEWGEGTISNGSSDDRNVTVEVRWISGTCSPTAKWTLNVRGNTP